MITRRVSPVLTAALSGLLAAAQAVANQPLFSEVSNPVYGAGAWKDFPALEDMRTAWADIDGDGDMDLILMGQGASGPATRLFLNAPVAPGSWSDLTPPGLPQLRDGAMAWGDLDNDGRLDLVITGTTAATPAGPGDVHFHVYRNGGISANGQVRLTEIVGTGGTPCWQGCLSFCDVNNDGAPDLFQSGLAWNPATQRADLPFSRVYLNSGAGIDPGRGAWLLEDGTSRAADGTLPQGGLLVGKVDWADLDRNGLPDLILSGALIVKRAPEQAIISAQAREEVWFNPGSGIVYERIGDPIARSYYDESMDPSQPLAETWLGPKSFREMFGTSARTGGAGDLNGDGGMDLVPQAYPPPLAFAFSVPNAYPAPVFYRRDPAQVTDRIPGFDLIQVGYDPLRASSQVVTDIQGNGTQQWLASHFQDNGLQGALLQPAISLLGAGATGTLERYPDDIGIVARFRGVLDAVDVHGNGGMFVLHSGFDETPTLATRLYTRNAGISNGAPSAPTGLVAQPTSSRVHFSWSAPSDDTTKPRALRYALVFRRALGALPEKFWIRPNALQDGRRLIPGLDGTVDRTEFDWVPPLGTSLQDGTYSWSVQAVDLAGRGSPFAPEQSFIFGNPPVGSNPPPVADPGERQADFPWRDTVMELGDVDNDGDLDVLLAGMGPDFGPASTVLRRNDGPGAVDAPWHFASLPDLPSLRFGAARWGDVDNDGDLDLAVSGRSAGGPITLIYEHNGGRLELRNTLDGLEYSALDWGDFDNDGDLDLIVTGYRDGKPHTLLYRNDADPAQAGTLMTLQETNLPEIGAGAVAWGDFDGDGVLDLVLCGDTRDYSIPPPPCVAPPLHLRPPGSTYMCLNSPGEPAPRSVAFRNAGRDPSGRWIFVPAGSSLAPVFTLPGSFQARVEWCDFNHDGRPDLLVGGMTPVTGYPSLVIASARVYLNNGAAGFPSRWSFVPGMELVDGQFDNGLQTLTCADWDADGYPDVLLSGWLNGAGSVPTQIRISRNQGSTFRAQTEYMRTTIGATREFAGGPAAFGHFNGDYDVDVAVSGRWGIQGLGLGSTGEAGRLYVPDSKERSGSFPNTPPDVPAGLAATVAPSGTEVTFTWNPSDDIQQNHGAGVSYNLHVERVDGKPGGMPGMADPSTGRRRVCRVGNVGYRTSWTLRNLPAGQYRWRVQAVDASLATSAFAPGPQTLTLSAPNVPPPVPPKPWHDWIAGNPRPAAVDFLGVASAGSARMVVGRRGQVLLSLAQEPFASVAANVATDLYDVVIDGGMAVVVGDEGTILTTQDGYFWNTPSSGTSARLRAVARGANAWVAAGDGVAVRSSDLVSWSAAPLPAGTVIHDLTWALSRFVAVGELNGAGVILTSVNGVNWTSASLPTLGPGSLGGVASDGVKILVTGGQSVFPTRSDTVVSTDAVTWTATSVSNAEPRLHVTWSGGRWFAAGDANLYNSLNGVSWQPAGPFTFNTPHYAAIAASEGVVTTVAAGGTIFDSPDTAVSWTRRGGSAVVAYEELRFVAAHGGTLVAASGFPPHYVSTDGGRSWQSLGYSGDGANGLAFGAGRFVRTHPGSMDSSVDGLAWQSARVDSAKIPILNAGAVAFGNNVFVASRGSGGFYSSADGIAWASVSPGIPASVSIAFGNGGFMAIDAAGNIRTSTDGQAWSQRGQIAAGRLGFAHDRYFAFPATGVLSSPDGLAWQPLAGLPPGASFRQIVRHQDLWFAVGSPDALLLSSPDLVSWTSIPIPATGPLLAAVSTEGGLVVAGTGQALLLSPNPTPPPPQTLKLALSIPAGRSDGVFAFRITGPKGLEVVLERSPDMAHWTVVETWTLAGGTETFEHKDPVQASSGFFRLRSRP